jgi:signal transduction histidine kinase
VIGNLELALTDLPEDSEPADRLNVAMEAAVKAAGVSTQMLTCIGHSAARFEPLHLSEACRESLPRQRAAISGKVTWEANLPSPGPVISANAVQLQRVLTNLITNAWEATGENGGAIHLRVKMISRADITTAHCHPVHGQPRDDACACLEVEDAGCGIANQDFENLFDPFYSSKFTGRGLGLAEVLGIARAPGGAVTVESEVGRGSKFQVLFPVSAGHVPQY